MVKFLGLYALVGSALVAQGANAFDPFFYHNLSWEKMCVEGLMQTPINLPIDPSGLPRVPTERIAVLDLPVVHDVEVVNKGHAIQVEWNIEKSFNLEAGTDMPVIAAGGSSISDALLNEGISPDLQLPMVPLQYHLHTPSEHAFNGYLAAMELHIVTAVAPGFAPPEWGCDDVWNGGDVVFEKCVAVFAVMYLLGGDDAESPPVFDKILSRLNYTDEARAPFPDSSFDLASLLPEDKSYYSYVGSLTTPPCSEGVRWHVMAQPVVMSAKTEYAIESALSHFKENNEMNHYRHNNRPIQPLNGRPVWFHKDDSPAKAQHASQGGSYGTEHHHLHRPR